MSHSSLNTDGPGENFGETEFTKVTAQTNEEGYYTIGDAALMAREAKPSDKKPMSAPAAGPSSESPRGDGKKVLRKHGSVIKSVKLPAKMSREKIGMAEKLTKDEIKYEDDIQPSNADANDGTDTAPVQTNLMLQDCRDFLMHAVLLALVTTIGIYTVPLSRFYYHDIFSHFLLDSTFKTEAGLYKNFWEIVIVDQLWDYFSGILIPLIYSGVNDKMAASHLANLKNPKGQLIVNDNILVALPRVRQVRVRNDSCHVPEGFVYIFDTCYYFFNPHLEDKGPFGLENGTLWTYSDASVTGAGNVAGEITEYTGGGYFMDFSPTLEETIKLYNEMFNNTWIDHGTRAVMIDLASYTQRDNLFCIVTLLIELPPSGGALPSADVRVQKLLRYESIEDLVILGFELALATLLVLLTLDYTIKFVQQPMQYILNFWNAIDWLMLALGYSAGAVGVWRYFTVEDQLSGLLDAIRRRTHFSFHSVRSVQTSYELLIGCFAFVAWLKTCRYASLFRPGALMLRAFRKVRTELIALTIMLLLLVFGFAMFAHVLFGPHVKEFSTIKWSLFSLIALFAGGLNFYGLCEETRPILAPFFFICYIFVVMILFVNWFAAAIVYGLKVAAQETDVIGEELFVQDILRNAYKKLLLFCKCRKLYTNADESDLKKLSNAEIVNNLLERNGFSRLERELFLRRHGLSSKDLEGGTTTTINVDDIIADLNGMNRYFVEVGEHSKVHERINELKLRLEVLDHTLADMIVKTDVLVDKHKFQEEEAKKR